MRRRICCAQGRTISSHRRTSRFPPVMHEWFAETFPEPSYWLASRMSYSRTAAVMSMVGYILGLGDRHPSNLLLERVTGKVVHIDFGDCFEVAMHREKYPERVPFRLTRMLTFAMEVSNIEGSYRITCEAVMRVIRENKDSLMAVLEAVSRFMLFLFLLTCLVHL